MNGFKMQNYYAGSPKPVLLSRYIVVILQCKFKTAPLKSSYIQTNQYSWVLLTVNDLVAKSSIGATVISPYRSEECVFKNKPIIFCQTRWDLLPFTQLSSIPQWSCSKSQDCYVEQALQSYKALNC